jgi:hypothetical protein
VCHPLTNCSLLSRWSGMQPDRPSVPVPSGTLSPILALWLIYGVCGQPAHPALHGITFLSRELVLLPVVHLVARVPDDRHLPADSGET